MFENVSFESLHALNTTAASLRRNFSVAWNKVCIVFLTMKTFWLVLQITVRTLVQDVFSSCIVLPWPAYGPFCGANQIALLMARLAAVHLKQTNYR